MENQRHPDDERLYSVLALAGALPFAACALLPLAGVEAVEPLGNLHELAARYGLLIICFLTGIHWATFLYRRDKSPANLFVVSNAIFLVVWFAYELVDLPFALATQFIAFAMLLTIDYRIMTARAITPHYFRIRSIATGIASVSIAIILVS